MKRKKVSSSLIKSIGFDDKKNLLEIEFKKEKIYRYFNFSKRTYDAFMKTDSFGKFFNKNIKGKYDYVIISQ